MKKYPLSTKAMKAMLAATIALTPVAGLGLTGVSKVEAADQTAQYTSEAELLSYLKKVNATLSTDDKATLKAVRDNLNLVTWDSYIHNLIEDGAPTTTEKAESVVEGIMDLLMSTSTLNAEEDFKSFKAEYKDEVKEVFGESITVDDLVGFIAATEGEFLKELSGTSGEVSSRTYFTMLLDSMETAKTSNTKNEEIYKAIDDVLVSELMVSVTMMDMIDGYPKLKTALLNAKEVVVRVARELPITPPAGGGGGGVVTPPTDPIEIDAPIKSNDLEKNSEKIVEAIKDAKEFRELTIKDEGIDLEVNVPNSVLKAVVEKNGKAKVVVQNSLGGYTLPVSEISLDNLAKELGVDTSDVMVKIIVKPTTDDKKSVEKAGLTSVAPVVEFSVMATASNGKEISIVKKKFTQYVDRVIFGATSFDGHSSTGVRINEDGSLSPLPTYFDGEKANIKSLTNSKYTIVQYEKTFKDVDNNKNWAEEHIEKLASKLVIKGKSADLYAPNQFMTRGEFAALISRSLGLVATDDQDISFSDVSPSQAVNKHGEIAAAVEAGIIMGHEDGKFYPGKELTRAEAAIMISRALDYVSVDIELNKSKDVSDFKDAAYIGASARDHVEKVAEAGIMDGYTNGQFGPQDPTKRDQMAKILDHFLTKINFIN